MTRFSVGCKQFRENNLLISYIDLIGFEEIARNRTGLELAKMLDAYYEFMGDIVEEKRGHVVKFMGDGGMVVFEDADADDGVLTLLRLKHEGDRWFHDRKEYCRQRIKAHYGKVACASVGTRRVKRFDIFGEAVNRAAMVQTDGFGLTIQLLEQLSIPLKEQFKPYLAV